MISLIDIIKQSINNNKLIYYSNCISNFLIFMSSHRSGGHHDNVRMSKLWALHNGSVCNVVRLLKGNG